MGNRDCSITTLTHCFGRSSTARSGRPHDLTVTSCSSPARLLPASKPRVRCFGAGDSNTDFERWDGLPSNLPALLSAALSGIAIWTTDLGGYMSLITKGRDPETLARWTEFAAMLPVMRTHHGTHPRRSIQFDHSAATLRHYGIYARLHTALFPLLRRLLDEASETGTPVCRPFLLEYAADPRSWDVEGRLPAWRRSAGRASAETSRQRSSGLPASR